MKKIIYVFALGLILTACKEEAPKDYITLSGTITNQTSDSLVVATRRGVVKKIDVSESGTFSDTLKLEEGNYFLADGKAFASIYLKNGYDLDISIDATDFAKSVSFMGTGVDTNNYLLKKSALKETHLSDQTMFELEKSAFDAKVNSVTTAFSELLENTKNLDSSFVANETKDLDGLKKYLSGNYEQKQTLLALKGNDSPKFVDYENYAGGTTSLDDLKGKYVYIDLWATWCGPCKAEIPFLKEVEKAYHGKNIEFVSISVDRSNAYDTWRNMVKEKELTGVQLYAKEDKSFMDAFKVNGIPRFILIDPQGKVVSADAPRPSNDKLKDLFTELNI